jgi:ABC-type amino acid transport substrate-binding protein
MQDVLEHFSWRKVAFLHSDDDNGAYGARSAIERARALGYEIESVYFGEPHGHQLSETEKTAIDRLKKEDFCIFVVVLHPGRQASVLKLAAEIGLFRAGYAWVVVHCNYGTDLFIESKMDGIICIRQETNSTVTSKLWEKMKHSRYHGNETSLWLGSLYAYNTVYALARALDHTLQSLDISCPETYSELKLRPSRSVIGHSLLALLRNETFSVDSGDRTSNYDYLNYYHGKLVPFAKRISDNFTVIPTGQTIYFPGGQTVIPLDTPVEHHDTLKALVPMSYPFTDYIDKETEESCIQKEDKSNCEFTGVAIKLIEHIVNQTGLKLSLTLWTKSWNDLIKEVRNNGTDWDLAVGSVTVTSERSKWVTFSSSIYDSGLRILTLRPAVLERSYFEFFRPFRWSVWLICIVTVVMAAGVILYLNPNSFDSQFASKHPNAGKWNCRVHIISEAFYFVCCLFFAVHQSDKVTGLFSRVYVIVLSFWVLIMISAYTANMAAFLTFRHQDNIINSPTELVDLNVGCRPESSNWDYAVNVLSLRKLVPVENGSHAVQLLKSGDIKAYIADKPHVLAIAASDCSVVVVGPLVQQQRYAFPMKGTLPYHNQINKAIREVVENGFVTQTFDAFVKQQCPPLSHQEDIQAISLKDIGGLFMLAFGLGFTLASVKVAVHFLSWLYTRLGMMKKKSSVAPV